MRKLATSGTNNSEVKNVRKEIREKFEKTYGCIGNPESFIDDAVMVLEVLRKIAPKNYYQFDRQPYTVENIISILGDFKEIVKRDITFEQFFREEEEKLRKKL